MIKTNIKCAVAFFIGVMVLKEPALAKKKGYSDPCDNAFEEIPKVDDNPIFFQEFHRFHKKNLKCVNAGITEEISARLVLGFNKNWKQLDQIIELSQKDLQFKKFILSNYAVATNGYSKDAESTLRKAKRCPKKQNEFCKELQDMIKLALAQEKKN